MFNATSAGILKTNQKTNAIGHMLLFEINAAAINPIINAAKLIAFIFSIFSSISVNASKIGKKNTAGTINDINSEISSLYRYIKYITVTKAV